MFENLPPLQLVLSLDEEVKESQSLRHVMYVSSCSSTLALPILVSCGVGVSGRLVTLGQDSSSSKLQALRERG